MLVTKLGKTVRIMPIKARTQAVDKKVFLNKFGDDEGDSAKLSANVGKSDG